MRFSLLALGIALISGGCATQKAPESQGRNPPSKFPGNPLASGQNAANPRVTSTDPLVGRVASVNPIARFVVLDFPIRRVPVNGQRLSVYRQDQKVGEVKITGPARDTTIAADIVAGEAQLGDEVRED